MKPSDLMAKAFQAASSAKMLLEAGDTDGACNRACHAMFDAARAALLASDASVVSEVTRTHGGLITAFSMHLVKTGRVSVEFGRALNRAEELRLIADYKNDPVAGKDAAWAVEQAQRFIQNIQDTFMRD